MLKVKAVEKKIRFSKTDEKKSQILSNSFLLLLCASGWA